MLSSASLCLVILSTGYSALSVWSLCNRPVEEGSCRFLGPTFPQSHLSRQFFVLSRTLVPQPTDTLLCMLSLSMVTVFGAAEIIRGGPTILNNSFESGLCARPAAEASCLDGLSPNTYWSDSNVGVTRTCILKYSWYHA